MSTNYPDFLGLRAVSTIWNQNMTPIIHLEANYLVNVERKKEWKKEKNEWKGKMNSKNSNEMRKKGGRRGK